MDPQHHKGKLFKIIIYDNFTLAYVQVFVRYNSTPIVMASGRELCYCMLTGILLCYLVTFVLVARPSASVCAASRILIGLSMSAIYAAVLTKTNRLSRVFTPKSAAPPSCILPWSQVNFKSFKMINKKKKKSFSHLL